MEQVEIEGTQKVRILHSHFDKEFSNKHVILKESAMSFNKKPDIIVNSASNEKCIEAMPKIRMGG